MPRIIHTPPTTIDLLRGESAKTPGYYQYRWKDKLADMLSHVLPTTPKESLTASLMNVGMPVVYSGMRKGGEVIRKGMYVTDDINYAKKFASQYGESGTVNKYILKSDTKEYPKPIWWQDYKMIFNKDKYFKGYDVVRIIEPNGDKVSTLVLNPSKLEFIKE